MGKTRTVPPEPKRQSIRLREKLQKVEEPKKKAIVKRAVKPKKAKQAENGNPKAEETKAEATEATEAK